ncbi:MAG: MOSC domain-containing protein [Planctomycetes bacterium]|nr:MOSC domain-containing protein [Planctomycetota bacterium]MBI3834858.1 MOSC domain-containing protein [Planctomycetota bacterium]
MDATIVAVNISKGGIPKHSVMSAHVGIDGVDGDFHEHEKHRRIDRAVTIQDVELLDEIGKDGFTLSPGLMGENLTVRGLDVQHLLPGDRLLVADGPHLELTRVRKPCYVLDQIDPKLKDAVVGRCGFLARVIVPGNVRVGQGISVERTRL